MSATAKSKHKKEPVPDEGYSWLVALACFTINFILVGMARSISVMYVALLEEYPIPRESATFPFSLRSSVKLLSGPLVGLLGQRYGIRLVTTAGGFVAGIGGILCYFAPDIFWITMFWGVIHGIGFGLSTVLHMMMIGEYFDKYKASALGLSYSGDCFGTFVFPVIMETLLSTYDVKGTFLILGGIVLNVIPMALLLKKPPWAKKRCRNVSPSIRSSSVKETTDEKNGKLGYSNQSFVKSVEDITNFENNKSDATVPVNEHGCLRQESEITVKSYTDSVPEYRYCEKENSFDSDSLPPYETIFSKKLGHMVCRSNSALSPVVRDLECNRDIMERHGSLPPVFEKTVAIDLNDESESSNTKIQNNVDEVKQPDEAQRPRLESKGSMKKRRTSSFIEQVAHEIVHRMRTASFASQVAQEGFVASMSLDTKCDPENLTEEENISNTPNFDADEDLNKSNDMFTVSKLEDAKDKKPMNALQKLPNKQNALQTFLRTNTKPLFILISISMAFYAFIFIGVLTIVIDYAVDNGVSHEQGKYLIIGYSVADLFGRLTFGQVIDRKLVKMKTYSSMTMLLMGIFIGVIPLHSSFYYIIIFMCLYGFIQGGTAIMFPILISTYMDKCEESIAMGCLNFYGGLLMLSLAPMIGYFRDNTGSYDGVFYILGGSTAAVGLMWQLEPILMRFQNRKLENSKKDSAVSTKL